jgi:regulator of replication initiation timing
MVQGCTKDSDSGSTQALCRLCYDLIATGDMLKYYANYTGKNWMSDTVMKIVHLQQDKRDLQEEVDELKKDIQEAYILENDDTLSLNDLRTFYHENKNLKSQNLPLIHENQALTKENEALKERVEFLEKERSALVYNMDHAYNLGDGKFLTLDDLHDFYEDHKNIHDVVWQQHNRILLLGLELKALQKPKEETFSTMPRQEFEKRAEAAALKAAENVKFDTYTEGFRKGFDLGYEKAKDQYYE